MIFGLSDEVIIAASRFAAWSGLLLVAMVLARVLWERWPPVMSEHVDRIIIGSMIEASAWSVHQAFWWANELAKVRGIERVWFQANDRIIIIAYIGSLAGAALMISPITERLFGARWKLVSLAVVISLWGAGLLIAIRG